jgi:hypothetical protein
MTSVNNNTSTTPLPFHHPSLYHPTMSNSAPNQTQLKVLAGYGVAGFLLSTGLFALLAPTVLTTLLLSQSLLLSTQPTTAPTDFHARPSQRASACPSSPTPLPRASCSAWAGAISRSASLRVSFCRGGIGAVWGLWRRCWLWMA